MSTWVSTEISRAPTLLRVNLDKRYTAMPFLQMKGFHPKFSNSSWKQHNMRVYLIQPCWNSGGLGSDYQEHNLATTCYWTGIQDRQSIPKVNYRNHHINVKIEKEQIFVVIESATESNCGHADILVLNPEKGISHAREMRKLLLPLMEERMPVEKAFKGFWSSQCNSNGKHSKQVFLSFESKINYIFYCPCNKIIQATSIFSKKGWNLNQIQ